MAWSCKYDIFQNVSHCSHFLSRHTRHCAGHILTASLCIVRIQVFQYKYQQLIIGYFLYVDCVEICPAPNLSTSPFIVLIHLRGLLLWIRFHQETAAPETHAGKTPIVCVPLGGAPSLPKTGHAATDYYTTIFHRG